MKTVIIYGSCYGTSERYARELARQTGAELHAAKDLRDLTGCGLAVHIGGLYAGGLAGLRQTLRLLPPDCWLMAVTVGLTDPALPENVRNIRASLDRQIPPDVRERTLFYHLRGGIRYDRLSLRHRVMMGMLRQTLLRRPAASLTVEDRLRSNPIEQKNRDPKRDLCFSVLWDYSSRTRTVQVALTPEAGFFTVMVTRPSLSASR